MHVSTCSLLLCCFECVKCKMFAGAIMEYVYVCMHV